MGLLRHDAELMGIYSFHVATPRNGTNFQFFSDIGTYSSFKKQIKNTFYSFAFKYLDIWVFFTWKLTGISVQLCTCRKTLKNMWVHANCRLKHSFNTGHKICIIVSPAGRNLYTTPHIFSSSLACITETEPDFVIFWNQYEHFETQHVLLCYLLITYLFLLLLDNFC